MNADNAADEANRAGALVSTLAMADHRTVAGFAYDAGAPDRKLVIEILADGLSVGIVRADAYCQPAGPDDRRPASCGFAYALPAALVDSTRQLTARLANLDVTVGEVLNLHHAPSLERGLLAPGAITTVAGSVISGWVVPSATGTALVLAICAGEEVAATSAKQWGCTTIAGELRAVLAFELQMPDRFVAHKPGGTPLEVCVTLQDGTALAGSPLAFDV
jgi:hypothetical protein